MKKLTAILMFTLPLLFLTIAATVAQAGHCDASDPTCHNVGAVSQDVYNAGGAPGAEFIPLTNLPGVDGNNRSLPEYLNALFRLLIGVGALFAVVRITLAGIKYMTTEAFNTKGEAKEDIREALVGLLILLSVVIVLQIINPNILRLDVLSGAPQLSYNVRLLPMSPGYEERYQTDELTPERKIVEETRCRTGGGKPVWETQCVGSWVHNLNTQQRECRGVLFEDFECEEYNIEPGEFDEISAAEMDAGLNVEKLDEQCKKAGGVGGALRRVDQNTFNYHCHANAYSQAVDNGSLYISMEDAERLLELGIEPEDVLGTLSDMYSEERPDVPYLITNPKTSNDPGVPMTMEEYQANCTERGGTVREDIPYNGTTYCIKN